MTQSTSDERWGVWAWAVTGPFASQGRWMMWGNPPRRDWTGTREAAEAEAKRFSINDWKAEARPYAPDPSKTAVTFERVKAVLTELDPEGLLKMGAPADEYDSEARTIADAVARGVPITPQYVRDVWLCWFGCSDVLTGEGLDQTPKTKRVYEMPHRSVFDAIAEAIGSSPARTKTTVLDGYYASSVYDDGFVFDIHHPDHDHGAGLREWMRTHDPSVEDAPEELLDSACRVYPTALLPEESKSRKGRWAITVTFEPSEEWLRQAPDGLGRVDCAVCGGRFTLSHRDPMCPHRLLP